MNGIFKLFCFIGVLHFAGLAAVVSQVNVDYVTLETDRKIVFKTSASSQEYVIQQTTWGADLFDKAYSLLMVADGKGNKVNFDYTIYSYLKDFGTTTVTEYEVTSITVTTSTAPSLCSGTSDNTSKTTYLTSLTLASNDATVYTFKTKCTTPASFSVKKSVVGQDVFNNLYALHIASLSKNKKIWLSCTRNTTDVLSSKIYRQ